MRGGADEHQHVVADALNRSEWSGHERRSVDWVRRDRGVCDVLMLDGVDEHRHVVADALDRSEWSAKRSRSEREADHERRSADMCKKCLLSVSLVNPAGRCLIKTRIQL